MDEPWVFEYAQQIKADWPKWKKNGYPINGPALFKPYFNGQIPEIIFKQIIHQWYKTWNVNSQIEQLQNCKDIFDQGIAQYLPLQEWGFDIPEAYNIVVTPFSIGGGGAGQRLEGHGPVITMWYGREFIEGQGRTPVETLLHEAYHLGIDQIVYEILGKLGISGNDYQWTRERIVDIGSQQVLVPSVLLTTFVQNKKSVFLVDDYLRKTELSIRERLQQFANDQTK
jgi:hypothetical protein